MKKQLLFVLLAAMTLPLGCRKNRPPAAPEISGPTRGKPGSALTYAFSSTDPENQEIAYTVAWDDASTPVWTADCPSGQEVSSSHTYVDTRLYLVKVKARDALLAESDWSDSIFVSVGFLPPKQPGKPSGPVACTLSFGYTYRVTTSHPFDDSVWFQFDWGDTTGDWVGPVPSDSASGDEHHFDSAGTFGVRARAKDAHDGISSWSEPLFVTVKAYPLATPNVSREATDSGATLRLSWSAIPRAETYEIQADDSVYTTTALSFDVTFPAAAIAVRAIGPSGRSDPATIDCRVVETPAVQVYGISDPDTNRHAGFAFRPDGTITTYTLAYGNWPVLDFFADDATYPGYMFLTNPGDRMWNEKGNAGKPTESLVFDNVRIAEGSGYRTQLEIHPYKVYCLWLDRNNNGWDAEDNFAKVRVTSIIGRLVTMRVGYQKIPGLRWLVN